MNAQLKLINDAFDALRWSFDHCSPNWADKLLDKCKEEERGHRGCLPDFTRYHTPETISVVQAAKLFAVKRVAEYLQKRDSFPSGKDYLHTQKSCFIAAGMVDEFSSDIQRAWQSFDVQELAALNYTDFVKVRREIEAKAGVA